MRTCQAFRLAFWRAAVLEPDSLGVAAKERIRSGDLLCSAIIDAAADPSVMRFNRKRCGMIGDAEGFGDSDRSGDRHASVAAARLSIESVDPGRESVLASAACALHRARREASTDRCSHADRSHCAVATVRLARCAGCCESGDVDSLAPRRMEAVLEDEVSARPAAHSP